jgi:hypothetical protein
VRVETAAGQALLARSLSLQTGQVGQLSLELPASDEDLWVRLDDDALALDKRRAAAARAGADRARRIAARRRLPRGACSSSAPSPPSTASRSSTTPARPTCS